MLVFVLLVALILLTLMFYWTLSRQEKEKKELFHTMAHKLRSPISVIKWYTELLTNKSAGTLNGKQKEYFNEICKASEKFNEIIDSFLKNIK